MTFLPKEHGAYGQMAFPLLTAMAVGGISAGSLLFATAVICGFLVHEPLLVALGLRGPRARRELGAAAVRWAAVLSVLLVASGLASLRWIPPQRRWTVALPLIPAAYLFWAALSGRGKTTTAEVAVAVAFSLVAVPLTVLGGGPVNAGAVVAFAFAANFVLATLAVRVVIVKVRGGGDPGQVAAMRWSVYVLAAVVAAAALIAESGRWAPPLSLLAVAPGLLVALRVATWPPPPAKLRTVGWTLVVTSAAIAVLLVVTLRLLL